VNRLLRNGGRNTLAAAGDASAGVARRHLDTAFAGARQIAAFRGIATWTLW
jgi:hypothetical protein